MASRNACTRAAITLRLLTIHSSTSSPPSAYMSFTAMARWCWLRPMYALIAPAKSSTNSGRFAADVPRNRLFSKASQYRNRLDPQTELLNPLWRRSRSNPARLSTRLNSGSPTTCQFSPICSLNCSNVVSSTIHVSFLRQKQRHTK